MGRKGFTLRKRKKVLNKFQEDKAEFRGKSEFNNDMKISKGKINIESVLVFLLIAILGIVFLYILNKGTHSIQYIQAIPIFIKLLFLIFILILIFETLKDVKTVDIYEDRICIKYFGIKLRTIKYSNITTYTTFTFENNNYLQIEISKNTIIINRSLLSNNRELLKKFNEFSHKRNQNDNTEYYRKKKNRGTILWGTCGFIILLIPIYIFVKKDLVRNRKELVTINGYLNGPFEIIRPAPKTYKKIYFKTQNYPEFTFAVSSLGYNSIELNNLETYTSLDTLEMLIEKSEHEAKILASRDPTFFEKHFNWDEIIVYELKVNKKTIFTFDQCMIEEKNNPYESVKITSIIIGVIGIFMILSAKKSYIKSI